VRTNGPYGADIQSIEYNQEEGIIYLATHSDGVFFSSDHGENWQSMNDNILKSATSVNDIFVDNNGDIFITTDSLGILRKKTEGSWDAVNSGFSGHLRFKSFMKIDEGVFLSGSLGKAIFKTTNYGESWVNYNIGLLSNENVNTIIQVKNIIFIGTDRGIFKSTDKGKKWVFVKDGIGSVNKMHYIQERDMVFAVTSKGIFNSVNSGYNWNSLNNGLKNEVNALSIIEHNDTLYVGTKNGLLFTTFELFEWKTTNNQPSAKNIQTLSSISGDLFIGSDFSLFKKSDDDFINVNKGLGVRSINCFINDESGVYAATDMGVYKTTNNGYSWIQLNKGFSDVYEINTLVISKSNIILAGSNGDGLYYSTDNGLNWLKNTNSNLTSIRISKLIMDSTGVVYAGTRGDGVFTSNDNGESWHKMFGGDIENSDVLSLIVAKNNYLFAGTTNNGLYRKAPFDDWRVSTDIGAGVSNITSLEYKADKQSGLEMEGVIFAATNLGVYKTRDNGTIWNKTSGSLLSQARVLFVNNGDTLFAGLKNVNGVFTSIDNGENWERYYDNSGIHLFPVTTFDDSQNGFTYAGTRNGGCFRTINSASGQVPLTPEVTVIGETSFCDGYFCVLDAGEGFQDYSWSDGVTSRFDTVWTQGHYWFQFKDPLGIVVFSDTIFVEVFPKPPKPSVFFNGKVLFCAKEADKYQWFQDGELINGATERNFEPIENGWYKCEITSEFGCINISDDYRIDLVDVEELIFSEKIRIYPNPSDGEFYVIPDKNMIGFYDVNIVNSLGEIIFTKSIEIQMDTPFQVNLSNSSTGLYYINIKNGQYST
ncbi:T9SS type A sorting domain-containing protein, partial [Bacteroidota bacterium]